MIHTLQDFMIHLAIGRLQLRHKSTFYVVSRPWLSIDNIKVRYKLLWRFNHCLPIARCIFYKLSKLSSSYLSIFHFYFAFVSSFTIFYFCVNIPPNAVVHTKHAHYETFEPNLINVLLLENTKIPNGETGDKSKTKVIIWISTMTITPIICKNTDRCLLKMILASEKIGAGRHRL